MQNIVTVARQTKKYLSELNLFKDETTNTDPYELRTAILSTRIYIVLLTVSILTLIVFNASGTQSDIITILNPSELEYKEFVKNYNNSHACPCSRITIPYANFTSTTVDYHPVCQSMFVSHEWINHLFNPDHINLYQADFRVLASHYFQLLASLCSHVKRSINDTLDHFHLQTFLTPNVLLQDSLEARIKVKSQFLRLSIVNSVRQLLQLVRTTTQSNELQTAIPLSTMMYMTTKDGSDILQTKTTMFRYTGSSMCACDSNRYCSLPFAFFNSSVRSSSAIQSILYITPLANLSGISVGCSPLESLLQSTLECLFDVACLHTIQTFIPSGNITGINTLNNSQTRFSPNTSIEILSNELFIEKWFMEANFSNYYTQCAPLLCAHTFSKQNNRLYIIIEFLSLFGGLTITLYFCIPRIVGLWRKRRTLFARESHPPNAAAAHVQTSWQLMRVKILELNLFKTSTMATDPFERGTLRISTWIYLILLLVSTIIIVLFNWFSVRIETKIVTYPTLIVFEELHKNYSTTLQCPCSHIAIPHSSFISIAPQFHPVCSSVFTTDQLIEAMGSNFKLHMDLTYKDIFQAGSTFFISLQTFCILLKTIVSDSIFNFNQSSLVTGQALSNVVFTTRAQQILDQFKLNTIAEAKHNLALIRSQIVTMYTTGDTDIVWRRSSTHNNNNNSSYSNYFQPIATEIDNCSCSLNENCKQQLAFYDYGSIFNIASGPPNIRFIIPNMFSSCFAIQSLLQSSLECLYERKCIEPVLSSLYKNIGAELLYTNATRFPPDMILEEIINEIMIETWSEHINYNQYYKQCAPKICTYSVLSRNNALYGFTIMIGLFGGLSAALSIIVPRIVTWIRNTIRRRINADGRTGPYTCCESLRAPWRMIKKEVVEFNLFGSGASANDHERRRYEILTTRLYLLLLTCTLLIMIIYTTVTVQTQSSTKNYPSQAYFEKLVFNPRYSSTLDCPCQNIAIPHSSFVSIAPHYHQFCSSDFIVHNSIWINLIYSGSDLPDYSYDDYRHFVVPHFRLLFYLCTLANDTFTDALSTFHSDILISTRAQSRQAIKTQIEARMNEFRSSLPKMFMRTLDFIQQMAQGNSLISSSASNWYPIPQKKNGPISIASRTYGHSNCSCAINSKCVSLAMMDGWIVPGFLIGCYPLESLLQSTLECLYDITCINKLKNKHQISTMNIRSLNSTLSSPNVTVQSLMNALMVDRWASTISYDRYYESCAPLSCTYVIRERANSLYMITSIIGSFGGLAAALAIIAPVVMRIARSLPIWRRRRRVVPNVAVISLQQQ